MKRWIWVLVMAPAMWGSWRLVSWANRLHAWHYSGGDPPVQEDYTRAAIVFWSALATPVLVGCVAAVIAFRRRYPARWPVGELCLVTIPWLVLVGDVLFSIHGTSWGKGKFLEVTLLWPNYVVGGVVVMTLLNLGACVRHRKWGKFASTALAFCAGTLYLFWLYTFIIYIDT